jgi:hypothetical protein
VVAGDLVRSLDPLLRGGISGRVAYNGGKDRRVRIRLPCAGSWTRPVWASDVDALQGLPDRTESACKGRSHRRHESGDIAIRNFPNAFIPCLIRTSGERCGEIMKSCWDSRQDDPSRLLSVLKLNRRTTTMSGSNFTQAALPQARAISALSRKTCIDKSKAAPNLVISNRAD